MILEVDGIGEYNMRKNGTELTDVSEAKQRLRAIRNWLTQHGAPRVRVKL